ncbi:MAG: DUF4242 domain-containing protein [Deltaproteobacteria bacterium]|nr:DUF4242 domain-containing protein [Deltaproteobacteria bacterium]
MSKLKKFMVVHNNPGIDCKEVQSNWRKLANVEYATWLKTYFNEKKGIRYCIWMAPGEEDLKDIFTEIAVSWESIIPVEETVPDLWGEEAWESHLEADKSADNLGT